MKHTWLPLLALATLAAACGDDGPADGADGGPDAGASLCALETRAHEIAPDLIVGSEGDTFRVRLVEVQPQPPGLGDNAWLVELQDAGGQPLPGLDVQASTFMPDHGHPGTVPPTVGPTDDGRYRIESLVFSMPGYWEVRLDVDAQGTLDTAVVGVCVEG